MEVKRICAAYWSATGNTDKTVNTIAETLAEKLGVPLERRNFTRPSDRAEDLSFTGGDLVVFGMPTYAGKLPNKMLPYVQQQIHGNGALAVGVVTFGNRSYDNSLAELCAALEADGFHTVAGGAFACRHAFTDALADGRPDWDDKRQMGEFAARIADKVKDLTDIPAPVAVPGDAAAPYYVPKGTDGQPVKFLTRTVDGAIVRETHVHLPGWRPLDGCRSLHDASLDKAQTEIFILLICLRLDKFADNFFQLSKYRVYICK